MFMLGCTPPGRHTEQHDIFFAIGASPAALAGEMKQFWPEAGDTLHVDAWRKVTRVDGHSIEVTDMAHVHTRTEQLFFINLGGYRSGIFDELHHKLLTIAPDKGTAIKQAKQTAFYTTSRAPGAPSHIDDHYGLDVDEIHNIADILPAHYQRRYSLRIAPATDDLQDDIHTGYFQLHKLPE